MLTIKLDLLQIKTGDYILDLGCGGGRHLLAINSITPATTVGVDLNHEDLKEIGTKIISNENKKTQNKSLLCRTNATKLSFKSHLFDHVICAEVLEHINDYETVIREIYRVLKPSGFVAVSVPRFIPEWICWQLSSEYHSEPNGHIRIFRYKELRESFESFNFRYQQHHWAYSLHVPYWWLQCLFWKTRENSVLIKKYHEFLLWDLFKKPFITRFLDKLLNPIMGKSLVMYFMKQ